MALRSSGRKFSFEILSGSGSLEEDDSLLLYRSSSDPIQDNEDDGFRSSSSRDKPNGTRKKRKNKSSKKKKTMEHSVIPENDHLAETSILDSNSNSAFGVDDVTSVENKLYESRSSYCNGGGSVLTVVEEESVYSNQYNFGELRQRNVNSGANTNNEEAIPESRIDNENRTEENAVEVTLVEQPPSTPPQQRSEPNEVVLTKLETADSLDWKRLMAEDPHYLFTEEKSPLKYFSEEMYSGNALRSTTTLGSEEERERVYDTIFRLPWRCEVLIDVGFFVCLDSFLSLLTIMPTRILMTFWRFLKKSLRSLLEQSCLILVVFLCWCAGLLFWGK